MDMTPTLFRLPGRLPRCDAGLVRAAEPTPPTTPVPEPETGGVRRLFTATLRLNLGEFVTSMFYACHATTSSEVMEGLACRIPFSHLRLVEVRSGIDALHPVVRRLVPSVTLRNLLAWGDCCQGHGPLSGGGVVSITESLGSPDTPQAEFLDVSIRSKIA